MKNNRVFPEEEITFRKLSIYITDNSLTVVKKILSKKFLLTLDIFPIDEKVVRVGFAKMRAFTVYPGFFQFVHLLFP